MSLNNFSCVAVGHNLLVVDIWPTINYMRNKNVSIFPPFDIAIWGDEVERKSTKLLWKE